MPNATSEQLSPANLTFLDILLDGSEGVFVPLRILAGRVAAPQTLSLWSQRSLVVIFGLDICTFNAPYLAVEHCQVFEDGS